MSLTSLVTVGLLLVAGGFVLGVMVTLLFLRRSHTAEDQPEASRPASSSVKVNPGDAGVIPPPPPVAVSGQTVAPPPPSVQYVPQVPPPPAPVRQQPGNKGKGKNAAEPERPASMVAQIDEILQEMISGTPLEARSIRLVEDLHHNAVVWVGIEQFDGIGSVPDPEVRVALQKAAAEYERRMERKKS